MKNFLLSFFYIGYIKLAPGSFASLFALIPAFFILKFLGPQTLFLLSVLISLAFINMINDYEKEHNSHDDKHIVIDELAGQFLACSLAAFASNSLFSLFLAFVFFRLFDITKPSIIGLVDKRVKGGLGVMLDDMLAGLFGGLLSAIIYGIGLKFELLAWDIALNAI